MWNHPATIEVIERFAYALKHAGDALHKWAQRLKAEPPPRAAVVIQVTLDTDDIGRAGQEIARKLAKALDAASAKKTDL